VEFLIYFLQIGLSSILLWKGADWVVEEATLLARRFGVSELLIGLTVVALGTSLPEMAVSTISAYRGFGDLALSNVVGSNIFNLGLILGSMAFISPFTVRRESVHRDGFFLGLVISIIFIAGLDRTLGRITGFILLFLLAGYIFYLFQTSWHSWQYSPQRQHAPVRPRNVLRLVLGQVAVVSGGHFLTQGAVGLGALLGVEQWLLGLTVVACGTSLPEAVTCLVSLLKEREGILIGNLLGSDIFNFAAVIGISTTLSPISITDMAFINLIILIASLVLLLVFMKSKWRLSRTEGVILFCIGILRFSWYFVYPAG
jgi:cation:H+ antiporter